MNLKSAKYLGVGALVLAIAGCEATTTQTMPDTNAAPFTRSWQQVLPTEFWVDGAIANDVLRQSARLERALEKFGGSDRPSKLNDRIGQIGDSNDIIDIPVPGLTGLGGIYGHAFLDAAERKQVRDIRRGNWGKFDNLTGVTISLSGQIIDYYYDKINNSGRIESITYVERTVVPPGGGTPDTKTDAYRFTVMVNGGFHEEEKKSANSSNVFPDFAAETGIQINSTKASGFNWKLWASGTSIAVTEVKLIKNYSGGEDWSGVSPLPMDHPKYKRLYQTDSDSCVDMMFENEPPQILPDSAAPPFYCLGRCKNPMIINTR